MQSAKKAAFFFDLDNTLFDYEASFKKASLFAFHTITNNKWKDTPLVEKWFTYYKAYCDLYWSAYEKKEISRQDYQRVRLLSSFEAIGLKSFCDAQIQYYQKVFEKSVPSEVEPFEWIKEIFQRLDQLGILIGIISNGDSIIQREKIKNLKLHIPEMNIYISSEINVAKPNPDIFHFVKNCTNAEVYHYVGDAFDLDIVPAVQAGWNAIWWNPLKQPAAVNPSSIYNCTSSSDLIEVIKRCIESAGYSLH
ncbi:HAD family hydrolase [Fictibacillus sp. UD]|uniref:HAD family hydrolase n=1 Tax=Fictibacillus sp. UD TaxID=3038777 RepID=UPI003745C1BD